LGQFSKKYALLVLVVFSATFLIDSKVICSEQRLVSLNLASDEILMALFEEREILAKPSPIVALSTFADNQKFSNITDKAKLVKGRAGDNVESLVALKPTLVFLASFNRPEFLIRLTQLKLPFLKLTNFQSVKDVLDNIRLIGRAAAREAAAENLLSQTRRRLQILASKVAKQKKVRVLSFSEGGTIYGKGTTVDSMIRLSGGYNLAHELGLDGWVKVSGEALLELNPQGIIVTGESADRSRVFKELMALPGWKVLKAVREKRFIIVKAAELLSVSQHMVSGMESLQRQFMELRKSLARESLNHAP
jgi:iron complex transport system substrate-binding protein